MSKRKEKESLKRAKEALENLKPNQALLIADTMKNIERGSYWSILTAKEFSKVFDVSLDNDAEVQEVLDELREIANVDTVSSADGDIALLITYNSPDDFFELFYLINPNAGQQIEEFRAKVYATIENNYQKAVESVRKQVSQAYKKGKPFRYGINSLNSSGKTNVVLEVNGSKESHIVVSCSLNLEGFTQILDEVCGEYGVTYQFLNPVTGTNAYDYTAFAVANSKDAGGVFTEVYLID